MPFFPETFKLSTPSDKEILVERDFNAPRESVFDAFTKPELVRQWLLGPDGWTMPVCEIDLRPGGRYRYLWRKEATREDMGMSGVFREVVRPVRLVATEQFDEAWYPGEAVNNTVFEEREGGITRVRLTVLYESKAARDTATRSGMEHGMAAGYNRLERLLSQPARLRCIDAPRITESAPQLTAAVHLTVRRDQMRSAFGAGLNEVRAAVTAQRIGPAGPWFDHHLKIDPDLFDFEICVPVSAPVDAVGNVVSREIPALRVAEAVYGGPYEQLAAAWAKFDRWIRENGHVPAPDLYQCYAVGPEATSNPAEWRTELRRPLLDR